MKIERSSHQSRHRGAAGNRIPIFCVQSRYSTIKLWPHNVSPSWAVVRLLNIGVNPLAVVTRDASNPSTGLFAKQQVAGRLGLEPRTTVLETDMLPITPSTYVGHSGIEPETSELSALRANRLCQCPLFRLIEIMSIFNF